MGTFVGLGYGASAVATAGGFFGWSAAGAGGTAAWGGGGIYGTVTDPHFGGAYAGGSGTASLSSSSTTSQALQQRLSEAPDQRTACYPACLPDPNSAFPDTEAGRAARDAYYRSYVVTGA